MPGEIFISYRRADEARAVQLHRLLKARGIDAWYDAQLAAGEEWRAGIAEALERAPIFVLLFSRAAAESTEIAKELAVATSAKKTIVPVRLEEVQPKGAFLYELASRNWFDAFNGDEDRFAVLAERLAALVRGETGALEAPPPPPRRKGVSICVLPFVNMSGDPEQEYFSDGISEDIITDLSKVSALWVAARNTAFTFKGKSVDVPGLARDLGISHVLEGSVRKAGQRVRITAQLIDADGGHVWAERYDRDLTDIFALQDEIAEAIVGALKVRLAPEEKQAIVARGASNPDAYRYYLLAREFLARGNDSKRVATAILRLARKAVEIDPHYAQAWRLLGYAQERLRFMGEADADGSEAVERALALDSRLAEAHALKAQILSRQGRAEEAETIVQHALALNAEGYEANAARASVYFRQGKLAEAIDWYEKAAALDPTDCPSAGMAASLCVATGQTERARANAQLGVERAERILAADPDNASAISWLVGSLSTLGEADRAMEWIDRTLVFDPDDWVLRYNFACALARDLGKPEAALDLLEPIVRDGLITSLQWMKTDPDLDSLRQHPRFVTLMAAADARMAQERA